MTQDERIARCASLIKELEDNLDQVKRHQREVIPHLDLPPTMEAVINLSRTTADSFIELSRVIESLCKGLCNKIKDLETKLERMTELSGVSGEVH